METIYCRYKKEGFLHIFKMQISNDRGVYIYKYIYSFVRNALGNIGKGKLIKLPFTTNSISRGASCTVEGHKSMQSNTFL